MSSQNCQHCSAPLDEDSLKVGRCNVCHAAIAPAVNPLEPSVYMRPVSTDDPNATEVITSPAAADITRLGLIAATTENSLPSDTGDSQVTAKTERPSNPDSTIGRPETAHTNVTGMHPSERIVADIRQSRDQLIAYAQLMQSIAWKVVVVCTIIMVASWIYQTRPIESAAAPPQGVATLITTSPNSANGQNDAIAIYFAGLQKIDLQRIGLVNTLDVALTGQPETSDTLTQNAQELVRDFLALKPPVGCSDLSNAYYQLLLDQTAMIGKAGESLKTGDIRGAQSIHDLAATQLTADASAADQALQTLCSAQQTTKPFDIIAETQTPGVNNNQAGQATSTPLSTPVGSDGPNASPTPVSTPTPLGQIVQPGAPNGLPASTPGTTQ